MPDAEGPARFFGEAQAEAYDSNFARLAPLKDALHLCMRAVLSALRNDARLLCVGAGTGAELLYLADAFPRWTFVIVEPSGPMLQRCRKRAAEAGIEQRCVFHKGYLESLPQLGAFDAATAILVSQFLVDQTQRCLFFRGIAERLCPKGILVSADLAGVLTVVPGGVTDAWLAAMRYNGMNEEGIANYRSALQGNVAVEAPEVIESLIQGAGFEAPVRFCQTLLIHAWCARRNG